MYSDVGADFLSFKIFIVYKSLAMAECMDSNGLREALLDLQSRNCFLSTFESWKAVELTDTRSNGRHHFKQVLSAISEWYGERAFSVKWLIQGKGCPFQIGSVVTILYSDKDDQGRFMALANSSGVICFVSTTQAEPSSMVMKELDENTVKLKWFDSEKRLELVVAASTRVDFIQIKPVDLIR